MRQLQAHQSHRDRLRTERQFQALAEHVPAAFSFIDAQQRYRFVNRKYEQWFGIDKDKIVGMHVKDLLGEPAYEIAREYIEAALAGEEVTFEALLPYRRGGGRWVTATYVPLIEDGRLRGLIALISDVTQRRQAEHELRQSEERLSLAMRATNDGIWDCDLVHGTVWWNEAYTELFGERPQATSDSWDWWIERLHPDDRDRVLSSLRAACNGQAERWDAEYRLRRPDGEYAYVMDRAVIARGPDGTATRMVGAMLDVTERRQAARALRESEAFTRSVLASPVGNIAVLDPEGRIIAVNSGWEQFARENGDRTLAGTGTGVNYLQVCRDAAERGDESAPEALAGLQSVLDGRRTMFTMEYPCHSETERRWFQMTVTPAQMSGGGLVVAHLSITERKQAEQALRESEQRLRAIVNTAADAIISFGPQGRIESVNPAAERMFGYQAGEIIGKSIETLMPSPYRQQFAKRFARYKQTGETRTIGRIREFVAMRKDGSTFPVELAVSEADGMDIFTGILRDVSERKSLQQQLLSIAEEQQQQIGRELHDDIGQQLTGLGLMAATLLDAHGDARPFEAELAEKIGERVREALGKVRSLSRGLIPVVVDAEGLMAALADMTRRITEVHGLRCEFRCDPPVPIEDNRAATQLYRIAQEAVTNAVRHACAARIVVKLQADPDEFRLTIVDDGIGIPNEDNLESGIGLKTMRHRAGLIGANLTIEPAEKGGTVVACRLPSAKG